eukprot:365878-Chlamydomonas_euryale.AAC.6
MLTRWQSSMPWWLLRPLPSVTTSPGSKAPPTLREAWTTRRSRRFKCRSMRYARHATCLARLSAQLTAFASAVAAAMSTPNLTMSTTPFCLSSSRLSSSMWMLDTVNSPTTMAAFGCSLTQEFQIRSHGRANPGCHNSRIKVEIHGEIKLLNRLPFRPFACPDGLS